MWLQSLSLISSLTIFVIAPVSPDLNKTQKGIIGAFSGFGATASLVWLIKSPMAKISQLEIDLELNQKGFRDAEARLVIERSNLEESQADVQKLIEQLEILKVEHNEELKSELLKYNKQIKDKDAVCRRLIIENAEQINKKWQLKLDETVNNYEEQCQQLNKKLAEYETKREYLKNLIEENEQTKKLLELDKGRLELEAGQVQLNVERQIATHQNALENSIRDNENLQAIIVDLQGQIEQLNQYINLLQNEMNAPKNQDVRQILKLFAVKEIRLKYIESNNICGIISHEFEPLSEFTEAKIKEVCTQLPGFIKELKNAPNYSISQGKICIKIDNRETVERIKKVDSDWLVSIAKSESNLLILGARGTGKSELANNYSALIHESVKGISYKFIQPKPDDYSVFQIGNKFIKPDYLGFSSVDGVASAYDGLNALNAEIHHRLKINQQCINRGEKCPNWTPIYWIIDEFQQLILQAESFGQKPKDVALAIKNAVSLGRSLNVFVLAIGQVPNVAQFPGWNKADFDQFSSIFLRDAISVGIDYSKTKSEENELREQFELYRKSEIKYYGLIRETGKNGYIAQLPEARVYFGDASHTVTESLGYPTLSQTLDCPLDRLSTVSHPIPSTVVTPSKTQFFNCPNCGDSQTVKNGKNRRKCKKCSKSFST